jgi:hypothetical protein
MKDHNARRMRERLIDETMPIMPISVPRSSRSSDRADFQSSGNSGLGLCASSQARATPPMPGQIDHGIGQAILEKTRDPIRIARL